MWQVLPSSVCELGESPFWHPHERALYWVDIPGRAVLRAHVAGSDIAGAKVERWALPTEPGCIAPARSGGLVIALRDGIYRAREWGGTLAAIVRVAHDTRTMRFNDGKCDAFGRFWAGSINEAKDGATAKLYCLDARSGGTPTLAVMADGATTANGLAFAPAGATLYWSDTAVATIRAWDWAAEPNTLSRQRVFHQFPAKPAGWTSDCAEAYAGRPDGATLDAEGSYWAAMYEGAQLSRLSTGGSVLETLPVPAQCPTMPCFGGEDLRTLFVTTARHGRPAGELTRLPDSGSVFAKRVEVAGRSVDFFED